jgi:hypothetical protein
LVGELFKGGNVMLYVPGFLTKALFWNLAGGAALSLFAAGFGQISLAAAQTFSSTYTSTASKDCRKVKLSTEADDEVRVCPGKAGLVVVVEEGDLRETVSVGRNRIAAAKEPAANTRFGPFNSSMTTVEWRAQNGTPFAIIQRWSIADNGDMDKEGRPIAKRLLIVTRLAPGPVCHVAYVDVKANPNTNELARKAADESARDFKCGTDKVKVIGASGRAVELAVGR